MPDRLFCLHIVAGLHPRAGGPSRTVAQLADSLAGAVGVDVALLSQSFENEPTISSLDCRVNRRICESASRLSLRFGLLVRNELERMVEDRIPSLIHNHGLWLPINYWATRTTRSYGIPLIFQPRGMLEPWALNHKALKKRIALALFQRRDLDTAKVIVATSSVEYENIRKLGFRHPIAVIPNGVKLLVDQEVTDPVPIRDDDNRIVLFLSRVHPVKGLTNLVRAWSQLAPKGWRLRIAGPDEGGHLQEIIALARELGVDNVVEYVGEVDGERKSAEYRSADIFVLPTYSENFGVVVAEALAHGVPVITTHGAPWSDLMLHGCGWWVEIGVEPLVQALCEAMALSDDERRVMGIRGRNYIQRYDWDTIAHQTIEVYRWVLGRGIKPDCIRID